MADGKVKISELSQALQLNDNAVFPYTQDNGGTDTTFKAPMTQIARKINEDIDFTNLETSSKKVVGAINQTVNNFAEVYDPTSTYNQNDPVLYGGTLYKCIANNVTGAWDSTKWDEAKAVEFGSGGGGASYATELPISSTDPTDTKSYIDTKTTLVKSASGDLITISDGGDNIPLKSCEVTIEPIQSGSGTPSPSNPRAISGHTEANLVVCGKNLFSQSLELGSIDANGQNSGDGSSVRCRTIGYISIPNSTLIVSNNLNAIVGCFYYDTNKTFILLESWESSPKVLNIPDNAKFVRFVFQITASNMPTQCQLEKGNQATTFEAYNGNTYTFAFGQTVYGGHFDNKGNLVLTHGFVEFDGSNDENWKMSSGTNGTFIIAVDNAKLIMPDVVGDVIANTMTVISYNTGFFATNIFGIALGYQSSQLRINVDTGIVAKDLTTFRNWLSNNHLQAVYELATPITLAITSQDIPTISGVNNIFSNCGDLDIEYFTSSADEESELFDVKTGGGYKIQPVIYSEDEREIGVWVDGKPLYQKTVIITNITITLDDGYSYDISSWNVDTIVKNPEGFVTISNETDLRTVPFGVLGEYATDITSTRSAVKFVRKGGSLPCNRVVFTLTYTKTTDQAGSGQWTPQGVPAHHYSTNEQIVGTWIDGSTLYEKTVTGTCPSKGAYGKVADITSETITNARIISGSVYRDNSVVVDVGSLNFELYLSGGGLYGYSNDNGNTGKTVIATIQYTKASS